MTEQLRAGLQAVLASALPERAALAVGPLTNVTTGWESEIYAFDLSYREGGEPRHEALVLRLHAGGAAHLKAAHEFRSLRLLRAGGYPVPSVLAVVTEAEPLGQPGLVMERVAGEPMWSVLDRSDGAAAAALLDEFGRLFVQLHRLDWRPFAELFANDLTSGWAGRLPPGPYVFADQTLEEAHGLAEAFPHFGLGPVVDWLAARRDSVPCAAPAVVHRDFHPANILMRPAGDVAVIDWTALTVTDPRQDVAWTLLLAGSYAGPAVRAAILEAYERHSGGAVSGLDWFEVVACGRRLSDVAISLTAGAEQRGMRAGAVALMRQQLGAVRHAAKRLEAQTGLRLPAIERLLSEDSA